ncbi:MAG: NAD-dependent DNA ligase LigA [Bacteroidota bacterium]
MTKKEAQQEIARLTDLVRYHNKLYHQYAQPTISDYAFDQLLANLAQLEAQFPEYQLPDSPTKVIGETPTKNFETVYHQYPMRSLSNTYSAAEAAHFVQRIAKQLPGESIEFFCELKFDGIAISLVYEQGVLKRVVTRGDGTKGDDITRNARQIKTIPQVIRAQDVPPAFEARGEVCMPWSEFERLNEARKAHGEEPLANPRNAAAGTLKTLRPGSGPPRTLDCYLYALRAEVMALDTHEEGIRLLERWGFNVSDTYQKCKDTQEVLDYIHYWEEQKKNLPVGIDGVVIKVNRLAQQNSLGTTAKSPRWATAYKYKPAHVATILEEIVYQVGRTGAITPVAQLQPILLAGTRVKRASLHNAGEIERLQLHLGDTVFIEKGGDIIPRVIGVDTTQRKAHSRPAKFVTHCPACGTVLARRYAKVLYYCPNAQCSPQIRAMLEHFVHSKAMDIQAIGKKTIALWLEKGLVRTPADLYALREGDIYALEGFKDLSTRNILQGIEQSKRQPFARVLFAIGIRHVGAVVAEKIAHHYASVDRLAQTSAEELMTIPAVGREIAHSVVAYFQISENLQLIEALKKAGLQLYTIRPEAALASQPLANKTFVISGTFESFGREALRGGIESRGGKVLAGVSRKLDYLVAGHHPGPAKLAQAEAQGIHIVDEAAIKQMMGW